MAEIREVVSEALQATVRRLLPSQRGFTEDLQASNVITPIIDLTPTAEGSALPAQLAQALSHGSNTDFQVINTTSTIINNTGFFRVFGVSTIKCGATSSNNDIELSDGTTDVRIYRHRAVTGITDEVVCLNFDFIVYLKAGDSLKMVSGGGSNVLAGSFRQVADVYGNIVNPVGFTFE